MDNTFDKMFYNEGELIAGIDESGVIDVAGPLVAACVILPKIDVQKDDLRIFEIDDSKKIPEKYRKKHAEVIWQTAIAIGIGEVHPPEIDYLGSTGATKLAMFRSIVACSTIAKGKSILPNFILVDKITNFYLPVKIRQKHIEQGDTKSLCIAAASIVAKVYRDEIMHKLHERFPYYDWASNKGYPCENHFRGLDSHGIQIGIHRTRRWPFMRNPSVKDDHIKWEKRRSQWKKVTAKMMQAEIGKDILSLKKDF